MSIAPPPDPAPALLLQPVLRTEGRESVPSPARVYYPELDGLRFFAFLGVFVHHLHVSRALNPAPVAAWVHAVLHAGEAGVELFFALSAFLITELLLREQQQTGRIDLKSFYIRRGLRIWPLYYSYLAYAFWIEPLLFPRCSLPASLASSMAVFLGNLPLAYWPNFPRTSALHLWTVSLEEQFYLMWPLILMVGRRRGAMVAAIGCVVVGCCGRMWLSAPVPGLHTLGRIDAFGVGALLALLPRTNWSRWTDSTRKTLAAVGVIGILLATRYGMPTYVGHLTHQKHAVWALCSGLILAATLRPGSPPSGLLTSSLIVFLGRISYGLYIFHMLGLSVGYRAIKGQRLDPVRLLEIAGIGFAVTALLATVSYFILEKPFLRLKLRFTHVASRPGG